MPTTIHKPEQVFDVLIIGAGISGIGAGIRLLREGFTNFVILEKAGELGGTWRDNTYPGCECDVPSALYSYSFAQKPDWNRSFAGQVEILDYVRETAGHHGVTPYIRYHQPVKRAQWDEQAGLWAVRTGDSTFHARAIIACAGYLHEPIIPDTPGLADFPGKVFHSSRWDHAHDLSGERVAVIGTGASAIQFVPKIQPLVKRLRLSPACAAAAVPENRPATFAPASARPGPAPQAHAGLHPGLQAGVDVQ